MSGLGTQIWQDAFVESFLWFYFYESKRMVACGSDFDAIKPQAYLIPEELVEAISVSQMYSQQEASSMQASHYAAQEAIADLKPALELHPEFADTVINDKDFDPILANSEVLTSFFPASSQIPLTTATKA